MSRYGKTMSELMIEVNEINDKLLGEDAAADKALRDKQHKEREARHAKRIAPVNDKENAIKRKLQDIKNKGNAAHDAILNKLNNEVEHEAELTEAGAPRGAPKIENVKFWDKKEDELRYIIKDAGEALIANPTADKATTGRGNWADQVNDAATVLGWRKKNGIKESNEGKLPPHLAKFFDKKGNPKPEVAKRMQASGKNKKSSVRDVTPKGYGPNEEVEIVEEMDAKSIAVLKKSYEPLRNKTIQVFNEDVSDKRMKELSKAGKKGGKKAAATKKADKQLKKQIGSFKDRLARSMATGKPLGDSLEKNPRARETFEAFMNAAKEDSKNS